MKQGRGNKRGGVRSAPTGVGVGKTIVLISKKRREKKKGARKMSRRCRQADGAWDETIFVAVFMNVILPIFKVSLFH